MHEYFYENIKKYKMDEIEIKVYKLCLLWEKLVDKEFPKGVKVTKLRKTGDPRKSILFKYCWKMLRETRGLIEDREYQLYIRSHLQVFKHLPEATARIDPVILCGEKAWKRWLYWRNLYKAQGKVQEHEEQVKSDASSGFAQKIHAELKRTKEFLKKQAKGPINEDFIKMVIENRSLLRWVTFGKVSPYYVVLSPLVKNQLEVTFAEHYKIKLGVFESTVNDPIKKHFADLFSNECA